MGKALIISHERKVTDSVSKLLAPIGHTVIAADNLQKGWAAASTQGIDAVLLFCPVPDGDGIALLPGFKELSGNPEVVVAAREVDPLAAERALRLGAWDYLTARDDMTPLAVSLDQALRYSEEQASGVPPAAAVKREKIVGNSPAMKACLKLMGQTAASDANVLITGETGTGKELFARAIHSNRPRGRSQSLISDNVRATKNFVVVDCTALPETLVESVLFGHTKGAFTGADRDQAGLIAQADGGTLFLDEIGELPIKMQKSFLRVLQERRYRPVGSKIEKESRFRLIAATNRDLDKMVAEGGFRKDLLFRLRALVIDLPPLRERKDDIKDLVRYHTKRLCERYKMAPRGFSSELLDILCAYAWPGNVRELVNTLDGMLAAAGNDNTLYPKHLPLNLRVQVVCSSLTPSRQDGESVTVVGQLPRFRTYRERAERQYLGDLMATANHNIPKAVEISGISRSRLYELLAKYQLNV